MTRRWQWQAGLLAAAAALALLGGPPRVSRAAAPFVVNDQNDTPDLTPADSLCSTGTGTCTLRAAIQQANANAGPDTIVLAALTYNLSRPGADDTALLGDLDIT